MVAVIVLDGISYIGIKTISVGAFVGSIVFGVLVFAIGTQMGRSASTTRLVLTGTAISIILGAITNLLIYAAKNSNQAKNAIFWTVGSLGGAKCSVLLLPTIMLIIVLVVSIFMYNILEIKNIVVSSIL